MISKQVIFFLIIIFIFGIIIFFKNRSKFWYYQPVSFRKNDSNDISHNNILSNGRSIKLYNSKIQDVKLFNNDINDFLDKIILFLNENYDDDLFFNKQDLLFLSNTHFSKEILFNLLILDNKIIGSIFYKIYSINYYDKKVNIITVDLGCVLKNYRNKTLFPYLIETGILTLKDKKLEFGIHKKDRYPLSIQEHSKYSYNYLIIDKMKKYANYNIKIDANPIISNDIYLRSMNDLRKKQIYFDFTEEQFKKEFTTNNVVKIILYKENNKYILLNGFLQTYRKDNKYELTFEIRYIFHSILEKNSLEKILGKLLYNIFIDYKVQYIMYQNIGNNIILDDLYDFINGHSTYLYLYNQKYREIKKEDFYFFF